MDFNFFCRKVIVGMTALFICLTLLSNAGADGEMIGTITRVTSTDNGHSSMSDESSLGSAIADAAVYVFDSDIAIINGGDMAEDAELKAGQVSYRQILEVFARDQELVRCTVTPAQLSSVLNLCLAEMVFDPDDLSVDYEKSESPAFPHIAGFTMTYDISAPSGDRVTSLRLWAGDELDIRDGVTQLVLICPRTLLDGEYGSIGADLSYVSLNVLESDVLKQYIAAGQMADYANIDRITVIGSTEDSVYDQIASPALILVVCAVVLFAAANRVICNLKNREYIYDPHDRAL